MCEIITNRIPLTSTMFESMQCLAPAMIYSRSDVAFRYKNIGITFKFTSRAGDNRHIKMTLLFHEPTSIKRVPLFYTEDNFSDLEWEAIVIDIEREIEREISRR